MKENAKTTTTAAKKQANKQRQKRARGQKL